MVEDKSKHSQIEGLATLLVLNDEIRKLTNIREFGFYATNETHHLIPYHTAYLWQPKAITGIDILAQSGIAEIDEHAPANQWLMATIKKILGMPEATTIHQIENHPTRSDLLGGDLNLFALDTQDEFADNLLWCPFLNKSNEIIGGLVLFRETPYTADEIKMIRWLIASYQYTWHTLQKQKRTNFLKHLKKRPYLIAIYVAILVILLFPTRLTVFGVGTVSPKDPVLINAPMQGVIKAFAVNPGEQVKAGQLLLTLDKVDLEADVEVSKRDYLLTQAKLRSAINEGFDSSASRSDIPLLRAQLAIDQAHLNYTTSLLQKTSVTSPTDGIVIFDSKEDWIGQPVQTGERILVVANPKRVEVKISLPVTNYIKMSVGDPGKFYLYGQLSPAPIVIKRLGYNAEIMPNKILGYQLVADFVNKSDTPQLGSQGNVEVYGKRVPFFYYILRKPIQNSRRMLGI
jgi:hypothetical protein